MSITPEQLKNIIKESIKEALPQEPKATLTIAECAQLTGIGRDKLMELAHSKKLGFPCFKVGTKFLVNRTLLMKWLDDISQQKVVL